MSLPNSHIESSLRSIKDRMVELANDEITDKTQGEILGLANELGNLADGVEDGELKQAIRHAAQMLGSGFAGYTVGFVMDNFASIEVLLP